MHQKLCLSLPYNYKPDEVKEKYFNADNVGIGCNTSCTCTSSHQ